MSTVHADTYANRLGTKSVGADYVVEGTAKAWANLDGNATIALRDSLNVSSVTDNGTGDYTFNWSSAMNNSDFSSAFIAGNGAVGTAGANRVVVDAGRTTSSIRVLALRTDTNGLSDMAVVSGNSHGDLA